MGLFRFPEITICTRLAAKAFQQQTKEAFLYENGVQRPALPALPALTKSADVFDPPLH